MFDADMTPKGPGKTDTIDLRHTHFVHEQLYSGVERSFCQLDLADIILSDNDIALRLILSEMQHIRPRSTMSSDTRRPLSKRTVNNTVL